jgi:hypothetical protein
VALLPAGGWATGTAGVAAGWPGPVTGRAGALKLAGLVETGAASFGVPEFWQDARTSAERASPKILFMVEKLMN